MFTKTKLKWLISIILAGILFVLATIGGQWGSNYSAEAGINVNPSIISIFPAFVPSGSRDKVIVVSGADFGDEINTGVRLLNSGYDDILHPISVILDGVSVNVTDTLMTEPTTYILTVVKSTYPSIPSIPLYPEWDLESNSLPFVVFSAKYQYLPIINLNAAH